MTTVDQWTGQHAAELRKALRMSIQDFAGSLGIHERTVSKWEARAESIILRPINQASLDEMLRRADDDVRARVAAVFGGGGRQTESAEAPPSERSGFSLRHPVDKKTMLLVSAGWLAAQDDKTDLWLGDFYVDSYPVTNGDYLQFVRVTDHRPPPHWEGSTPSIEDLERPVTCVTGADARAYARWTGKDLPTVAHLEKALDVHGGRREVLGYEDGLFEWCRDAIPAPSGTPLVASGVPKGSRSSGATAAIDYPTCAATEPHFLARNFSLSKAVTRLEAESEGRSDLGLRCVTSVIRFPN